MLKALIAKDKTFWRAYKTLFDAYMQKKELDKAEEYFRSLLAADSQNGLANYGLGEIDYNRSQVGRAGEHFAACIDRSPSAQVCYLRLAESGALFSPGELRRRLSKDRNNPYSYLVFATTYQPQGKIPEALEAGRVGLEKARALNRPELEAAFHVLQQGSHRRSNEGFTEALAHQLEALQIFEQLSDWEGQLYMASEIGFLCARLGEFDRALAYIQHYQEIARHFRHRQWESVYLNTLGRYHLARGDNEAAIAAYWEYKRFIEKFGLPEQGAPITLTIGNIYRRLGRFSEALECFEEAQKKTVERGDKANRAFVLRSIGILYGEMGDYVKALRYQSESVEFFRSDDGTRPQAGAGISNVAGIYAELGAYGSAEIYYEQSLEIAREYHDAAEEQRLLDELGSLSLRRGQPEKALRYLTHAQAMFERVRYDPFKATILLNIGDAHMRLGQYRQALENIQEGLVVTRKLGSKPLEAESLARLGDCLLRMGDLPGAERNFSASLDLGEQIGLPAVVVAARRGLAEMWRKKNDDLKALASLRSAVETIEAQRNSVPTPELRSSFLEQNSQVYEDIIQVLSALHEMNPGKGYDRLGFEYAERGRARSFLDTLSEAKAQVTTGLTAEQARRQSELFGQLSKASTALIRESSARNRVAVKAAEQKIEDWSIQLRSTNRKYQELRYPEPFDLARIQSKLAGQRTALLQYALGTDRSLLWVIREKNAVMLTLPTRAEIEREVAEYRDTVARHPIGAHGWEGLQRHATRLYELLLRSAREHMAGVENLIIVPDGILYYLPFETLYDGARYLIEDFTIGYAPSASVFGNLQEAQAREKGTRQLLAFGDPAFGDKQTLSVGRRSPSDLVRSVYEQSGIRFAPLPNTRAEVQGIGGLYEPAERRIYLGRDASETAVKHEKLSEYRRVHFATHAVIDEEIPARSGVVLSLVDTGEEDGILRMQEIFNLELNADLVVLSACRTGLGKLVKGEGMVGLTRAFMYAGTPRVAVSLWEVNDLATADFMKAFYRHMKAGESAGMALRAAKLSMIHSEARDYRHPYYWAPFVLVGLL